jgi:hypothetical protein
LRDIVGFQYFAGTSISLSAGDLEVRIALIAHWKTPPSIPLLQQALLDFLGEF